MTSRFTARPVWQALVVLSFQLLVLVVLVAIVFFASKKLVVSVALGGFIAWLANAFFAMRLFSVFGAQQAKAIVRGFYLGEVGKWLVVMVGFWLALNRVPSLQPLPFLLAFVLVQMAHGVAPLVMYWLQRK